MTQETKQRLGFKLGVMDWVTIIGLIVGAALFQERRFANVELVNSTQQVDIDRNTAELKDGKSISTVLSRIEQHLTDIDRRLQKLEDIGAKP